MIRVGSEYSGAWGKKLIDYLLTLSYPNREILWVDQEPYDILIRSISYSGPVASEKYPYIVWSGENYAGRERDYPPLLNICSHYQDGCIYVPFIAFKFNYADYVETNIIRKYVNKNRKNFVAYCNRVPVMEREKMFSLLKKKDKTKTCHGLGQCSNTGHSAEGDWDSNSLLETYSNYRFVFAMENTVKPGYITEKIMNAFMAGSVPIYWGHSEAVKNIFNEKAFVCVNDFSSLLECANYIVELDKDQERYEKMVNESIFRDGVPDVFRIGDIETPPEMYVDMAKKITKDMT